jgi:hypothetical protein
MVVPIGIKIGMQQYGYIMVWPEYPMSMQMKKPWLSTMIMLFIKYVFFILLNQV